MSHFAKLDSNNIVTEVIVATQQEINSENHGDAFNWIQCSYNNNFRGRFPGIGTVWNPETNMFLSSELPDNYPDDGEQYQWNSELSEWELVPENHGL